MYLKKIKLENFFKNLSHIVPVSHARRPNNPTIAILFIRVITRVAAYDGNDRDRRIDRSIFPDRGDRIDHSKLSRSTSKGSHDRDISRSRRIFRHPSSGWSQMSRRSLATNRTKVDSYRLVYKIRLVH